MRYSRPGPSKKYQIITGLHEIQLRMTVHDQLDLHEKPPNELRDLFKRLKGRLNASTAKENGVIDLTSDEIPTTGRIPQDILANVLARFQRLQDGMPEADMRVHGKVHSFSELPGRYFLILPSNSCIFYSPEACADFG